MDKDDFRTLYDYALKTQVETWRRVGVAMATGSVG